MIALCSVESKDKARELSALLCFSEDEEDLIFKISSSLSVTLSLNFANCDDKSEMRFVEALFKALLILIIWRKRRKRGEREEKEIARKKKMKKKNKENKKVEGKKKES